MEHSSNNRDLNVIVSVNKFEDMISNNENYYFDVEEFIDIIDYYLENDLYKKAFSVTNIATKQHPGNVELLLRKAQLYSFENKIEEAFRIIEKIETIESDSYEIILLKARMHSQQKNHEESIKEYLKLIELDDADVVIDEILMLIALEFESLEDYPSAIKLLSKAVRHNPRNILVLEEVAYLYSVIDKLDECISLFSELIDKDPYSSNLWYCLGSVYDELGKHENAVIAFDYALVIDEDYTSAYYSKAQSYTSLEEYSSAIDIYEELIQVYGESEDLYCNIAECYEKLNMPETAINNYNFALDVNEEFSSAYFGIASIYYDKNSYTDSFVFAQRAVSCDANNAEYLLLLANLQYKLDFNKEAKKSYDKALNIDELNLDIWMDYSDFLYNSGKKEDCIELLGYGFAKYPSCTELSYRLAGYLISSKQMEQGINLLRMSMNSDYELHHEFLEDFPKLINMMQVNNLIAEFKSK